MQGFRTADICGNSPKRLHCGRELGKSSRTSHAFEYFRSRRIPRNEYRGSAGNKSLVDLEFAGAVRDQFETNRIPLEHIQITVEIGQESGFAKTVEPHFARVSEQ